MDHTLEDEEYAVALQEQLSREVLGNSQDNMEIEGHNPELSALYHSQSDEKLLHTDFYNGMLLMLFQHSYSSHTPCINMISLFSRLH
jgi:hypothetical protein